MAVHLIIELCLPRRRLLFPYGSCAVNRSFSIQRTISTSYSLTVRKTRIMPKQNDAAGTAAKLQLEQIKIKSKVESVAMRVFGSSVGCNWRTVDYIFYLKSRSLPKGSIFQHVAHLSGLHLLPPVDEVWNFIIRNSEVCVFACVSCGLFYVLNLLWSQS